MTAVFRATYSDWRVIKGRKVVQVVFETPIEQADLAYKVVGGMPNPAEEKWFAIARLASEKAGQQPRPAEQPTKPAGAKSYAQRVALLCKEPRFWRFLSDEHGSVVGPVKSEADAAEAMRIICGVKSRSEIVEGTGAAATAKLIVGDYDVWLRVVS